nr:kremen protein 2-like [Lytechinus pictus]
MNQNRITIVFLVSLWIRFSICVITDVQLVGGLHSNKGTIEIKIDNGTWETTCGANTDTSDVIVICKHLGFKGANRAIRETPYGQNSTPNHGLFCDENDTNLSECSLSNTEGCSRAGAASCHGDGYLGCFVDIRNDRALSGESLVNSALMTISYCIQFCKESTEANYTYAGVINGNECYCGEASDNYTRHGLGSDVNCQYSCSGDPTESCGGAGYIACSTSGCQS